MSNNALVASNYKLAGVALPSGTTLTFVDNKQTVLVTLPVGYIKATFSNLAVSNVTAVDGISKAQISNCDITKCCSVLTNCNRKRFNSNC
jgi:hypothetical protein